MITVKELNPDIGQYVHIGEDLVLKVLSRVIKGYYVCEVTTGDNKVYFKGDTIQLHEESLVDNMIDL